MDFDEVLEQVVELLAREGRVSYRALKRRFELDDDYLEDLKAEIIEAKHLAVDENGSVLVWVGDHDTLHPSAEEEGRSPEAPEVERRQLTVVFADIVHSNSLAEQLDPEDLRDLIGLYQAECRAAISRFDGYLAQYLGDGVLAYFGYPSAHEDDAERAVSAALQIVERIRVLAGARGVDLATRVGIDTGLIVMGPVGEGERSQPLALGETPNVAAMVQGVAEPNGVVITASTHRLVEGLFRCEQLGSRPLKTHSPVALYRVLGRSEAPSRFAAAASLGLTPLVGRENEVELLLGRWAAAKEGRGQVVLLRGEAGIGKSRLAQVLKDQVTSEGHVRIELRCSPFFQNSLFHPVVEYVQRAVGFADEDSAAEKLAKLTGALAVLSEETKAALPLFASLLSLDAPGTEAASSNPRYRTLVEEAVVRFLLEQAAQQSLLLLWEDIHWADPSTQAIFQRLIRRTSEAPLLVVLTQRSESDSPWGLDGDVTQITLNRLAPRSTEAMILALTGGKSLPAELIRRVIARTDGVPLFVEELTKMMLEAGYLEDRGSHYELSRSLSDAAIPATLHDSLTARLDRLAEGKPVAQLAAVLGRQFSFELLHALSAAEADPLRRSLSQLIDAGLLDARGLGRRRLYFFKHALVQAAAYASLPRNTRQSYHRRAAELLEARAVAETEPELIAHHYSEAGVPEEAAPYWQRAGRRAVEHSAHLEALTHLQRGLDELERVEPSRERAQLELVLQTTLGAALIATRGYAAAEVEQAYARARELCKEMRETPRLLQALLGLHTYYLLRLKLDSAIDLANEALTLAQRAGQDSRLPLVYYALGCASLYQGKIPQSQALLERGFALYDPLAWQSGGEALGAGRPLAQGLQDPGLACLAQGSIVVWLAGQHARAKTMDREAQSLARELSSPWNQVFALCTSAWLHQLLREPEVTRRQAGGALQICADHEFPFWRGMAESLHGWAQAQLRAEGGVEQMQRGLEHWREIGIALGQSYWLARLAEVHGMRGEPDLGLSLVDEGLKLVETTEERFAESDLHCVRSQLLARIEGAEAAEEAARLALSVARAQHARSLELRAALQLVEVYRQRPGREPALEVLTSALRGFQEVSESAEVEQARERLARLDASTG